MQLEHIIRDVYPPHLEPQDHPSTPKEPSKKPCMGSYIVLYEPFGPGLFTSYYRTGSLQFMQHQVWRCSNVCDAGGIVLKSKGGIFNTFIQYNSVKYRSFICDCCSIKSYEVDRIFKQICSLEIALICFLY